MKGILKLNKKDGKSSLGRWTPTKEQQKINGKGNLLIKHCHFSNIDGFSNQM